MIAQNKKICLLKIDGIGDYILFRESINILRNSNQYGNSKITLVGNKLWKGLALHLDSNLIDDFVWIDINWFSRFRLYRYYIYLLLKFKKYDYLISPTYSRRFFFEDDLVGHIRAVKKIGAVPDSSNITPEQIKTGNKRYNSLLVVSEKTLFESVWYYKFLTKICDGEKKLSNSSTNKFLLHNKEFNKVKYVVVIHSSGEQFKIWYFDNYIALVNHLIKKYGLIIYLIGSAKDIKLGQKIVKGTIGEKVFNMSGKLNFPDLIDLVNGSVFVVGNDTGLTHLSINLKVKTICLYAGNHYGRFHPYPKTYRPLVRYVMPEKMEKLTENERLSRFQFNDHLDINAISVESVIKQTDLVINEVLK